MAEKISPSLTDNDIRFIAAMIQCMKGTIDADWDKVAEITGLKHRKSAQGTWCLVKKKLAKDTGVQSPKKSGGDGEKRKAAEGDDDTTTAPSKRRQKSKAKSPDPRSEADSVVKTETPDEVGVEGEAKALPSRDAS